MSWFRLDESFHRLETLRWEATAVYPFVAALSKQHRGVIPEAALQQLGEQFNGLPAPMVKRGVAALKKAGLLGLETRTLRRGRGSLTKTGYVLDANVAPDPRPMSSRRGGSPQSFNPRDESFNPRDESFNPRDESQDSVITQEYSEPVDNSVFNPRDKQFNPREQSAGSVHVPEIASEGAIPSRAPAIKGCRAEISPRFVSLGKEEEEEQRSEPSPYSPPPSALSFQSSLWAVYRDFSPDASAEPQRAWRALCLQLQREYQLPDLELVVRWAFQSLAYEWHRQRGLVSFAAILDEQKLPGRLESARRWSREGDAPSELLERHESFRLMDRGDQKDLLSWPSDLQRRWLSLASSDEFTGGSAMLEIEGASC